MRASMVLARRAVTHDDGRVDLVDAGWNTVHGDEPFVIVALISCPAELCGASHKTRIDLLDDLGDTVGKALVKAKKFRVERPKGVPAGSSIAAAPIVVPVDGFDHPPGHYALRLAINGMADDDWVLPILRAKR